jgi:hypothetical protein
MDLVSVFGMQLYSFVEEATFSPSYVLDTFIKNQVGIGVWIHLYVFCSVPLVFMSVLGPVPCCFYCCGSAVWFEVGCCDTSSIALFFQYCLSYMQSFVLPNEL